MLFYSRNSLSLFETLPGRFPGVVPHCEAPNHGVKEDQLTEQLQVLHHFDGSVCNPVPICKEGNKEGKKLNGNSHSLSQCCGKYGVSYTGHLKHSSSYTNEVK